MATTVTRAGMSCNVGYVYGSPTPSLLTLPGELRNRIYQFALACPTSTGAELCRFRPPQLDSTHSEGSHSPSVQSDESQQGETESPDGTHTQAEIKLQEDTQIQHQRSHYFHLMHVCRQIREEFRPLYLRHPTTVCYSTMTKYLKAFYPMHPVFRTNTLRLFGDIHVNVDDVSDGKMTECVSYLYRLPNLNFKFTARGLVTQNAEELNRLANDLNVLFIGHARAWQRHLESNIGKLRFIAGPTQWNNDYLEVLFKSHTPGIMAYGSGSTGLVHEILKELGLWRARFLKPQVRIFLG